MSKPVVGQMKVDKLLSQVSQAYRNEEYIADKILPAIKVGEKSGKIAKYGKDNLRIYSQQIFRAPGTRARSFDYSVSMGTYNCMERSVEKLIPDEMYDNTDDPYDPKRDATEFAKDIILGNREAALATAMADTSIITQNVTLSGTDQWSDYANSDPIGDIELALTTVHSATGKRPNSIAMSLAVWTKLKYHPDIREEIKYGTQGGGVSDSQLETFLKDFFSLKNVYVGQAVYNSADEGQTDSLAPIWGKHCWVFYQPAKPSLMVAAFGYLLYDKMDEVDVYREDSVKSDVARVASSFDQNIVDNTLCYLIKNAVA